MTEHDGWRDPDDRADRRAGVGRRAPMPGRSWSWCEIANAAVPRTTPVTTTSIRPRGAAAGFWQDQTDWMQIGFTAERDGEIVGVATMAVIARRGGDLASSSISCPTPTTGARASRRRCSRAVEDEARVRGRHGRPDLDAASTGRRGERLAPPTGCGSIPADDRQTRLHAAERLHARAGRAQQRVRSHRRRSPPSSGMLAEAAAAAGDGLPGGRRGRSPTPPRAPGRLRRT